MITLTIGIPAHNEAQTLPGLITDLLHQDVPSSQRLDRIIIMCDGCTDDTVQVARQLAKLDRRIQVINDRHQKGKLQRLSQLYRLNTSQVFVTFDADVRLGHSHVLADLVNPFSNPKIGLVGGGDAPFPPKNPFASIVVTTIQLWDHIRRQLPSYDSVYFIHGCVTAVRGSLVKHLTYPNHFIHDDDFLFFYINHQKYQTTYVASAQVLYQAPTNFSDYLKQTSRYLQSEASLNDFFGHDVYSPYKLPILAKLKGIMACFLSRPLLTVLALGLQLYVRLFPAPPAPATSIWASISSTKSPI